MPQTLLFGIFMLRTVWHERIRLVCFNIKFIFKRK